MTESEFNSTMCDLSLALLSLVVAKSDPEIDEVLTDVEKLLAELSSGERRDLEPQLREVLDRLLLNT